MNNFNVELIDSDGETDTFIARHKNEPFLYCRVDTSGSVYFQNIQTSTHIDEYEIIKGWIYKEVLSCWDQMNKANK